MKFKELLDKNYWLGQKIHEDTSIQNASITKYKNGKMPWFNNKIKIYEALLDYRLINPDETSIEELFS